jgi:aspartyl-tRNA synthetase
VAYDFRAERHRIGGGSLRIYNMEMQKAVFKALGISDEEANENSASCWMLSSTARLLTAALLLVWIV